MLAISLASVPAGHTHCSWHIAVLSSKTNEGAAIDLAAPPFTCSAGQLAPIYLPMFGFPSYSACGSGKHVASPYGPHSAFGWMPLGNACRGSLMPCA